MLSLEGKVVLITGASRGIGFACMNVLGRQGALVVGTATTQEGAQKISEHLEQQGLKGFGRVLCVQNKAEIAPLVDSLTAEVGPISILVNNAGITRDNLLVRLKDEDWDDVIATNLSAVFHLSRALLKGMMKARWGRIIHISSVVAASGNPGQTNYAAAKAGVIGFSKSLAQEVGSRGITSNVVAPGFIETDMTRKLSDAQREHLLKGVPMNRLGSTEEIAHAVAYLASEQAAYVTGSTLHVNGGMAMY